MKELKELIEKLDRRNMIWLSIMLLCLIIAVVSAVVALASGSSGRGAKEYLLLAQEAHSNPKCFVDFEMLTERNSDTAAWLLAEGTGIDHPVMQSEDSEKYRSRSFSGARNGLGCLYLDSSCPADLSGRNTVIYGGELLAPLYRYSSQDHYELLPCFTLYTPQGEYTVSLIAGAYTEDIASLVRTEFVSDEDFAGYISGLRNGSCFASPVRTDASTRLVTLCAEDRSGAFVLVGAVQ